MRSRQELLCRVMHPFQHQGSRRPSSQEVLFLDDPHVDPSPLASRNNVLMMRKYPPSPPLPSRLPACLPW